METSSNPTSTHEEMPLFTPPGNNRTGRILGGLVIVAAGALLFARNAGVFFPNWLFSFDTFLIALGLYIWARHSFQRPGGLILMLLGGLLLLDDVIPDLYIGNLFWPIIIIGAGIWMILSSGKNTCTNRGNRFSKKWQNPSSNKTGAFQSAFEPSSAQSQHESFLDSTAIFGAVKKNFFTKEFKGGRVMNFMGGTELNLSQAEIQEPVVLEITQLFGGTKLILPSHWQVRSEIIAILGGVEDKRAIHPSVQEDPNRVLILRGTTVFGGIDIKSY